LAVIEASADPGVEEYTRRVGMHNVIDMATFLRVLGDQMIQLTILNNGVAITSWVMKSDREAVEYIQVIPGRTNLNTINLEIDLKDFKFDGDRDLDLIEIVRILAGMLFSNRGMKKQPKMVRLMTAISTEFVRSSLRKNDRTDGSND
jgi:hypothetical protein